MDAWKQLNDSFQAQWWQGRLTMAGPPALRPSPFQNSNLWLAKPLNHCHVLKTSARDRKQCTQVLHRYEHALMIFHNRCERNLKSNQRQGSMEVNNIIVNQCCEPLLLRQASPDFVRLDESGGPGLRSVLSQSLDAYIAQTQASFSSTLS